MAVHRPLKWISDPDNPGRFKLAEFTDEDSLPASLVPPSTGGETDLPREVIKLETGLYLVGKAQPGTAHDAPAWQIYQLDYRGGTVRIYANGNDGFVHKWTEAQSKTYE